MALIPPDAGIRMRMQLEADLLQPAAPIREIPSDLPDLVPGQAFSARIQEALPNNLFRALVAGKTVTLQLPEGASPGDSLELVVVDRSPKAIVAQLATPTATTEAAKSPYPFATLSRAGQMLAQLLLPEGRTPQPAPLNRGLPLLEQPPLDAKTLAPRLEQAVANSGLFYESHQVEWLSGKRSLQQLLLEPQARHAATEHAPTLYERLTTPRPQEQGLASPSSVAIESESLPDPAKISLPQSQSIQEPPSQAVPVRDAVEARSASISLPDDLRPLVQQQLDAAGTQRLVWHGEVWPQQAMDWEVEWERPRDDDPAYADEERAWLTTLRLTTPRLGAVEARLRLTTEGVSLRLGTGSTESADDLAADAPRLAESLDAAGIPLLAFQIRHES